MTSWRCPWFSRPAKVFQRIRIHVVKKSLLRPLEGPNNYKWKAGSRALRTWMFCTEQQETNHKQSAPTSERETGSLFSMGGVWLLGNGRSV